MNKMVFHEASVVGIGTTDGSVYIDVEDVCLNGNKVKVRVKIESVVRILIDNNPSSEVSMAAEDGEVLSLDVDGPKLYLLVEWNDFSKNKSFTQAYDIEGRKINYEMT